MWFFRIIVLSVLAYAYLFCNYALSEQVIEYECDLNKIADEYNDVNSIICKKISYTTYDNIYYSTSKGDLLFDVYSESNEDADMCLWNEIPVKSQNKIQGAIKNLEKLNINISLNSIDCSKIKTSKQEFYIVELYININNVELYPYYDYMESIDQECEGARITIIIDQEGVQRLWITGQLYEPLYRVHTDKSKITLNNAVKIAEKFYSNMKIDNKLIIYDVEFQYMPLPLDEELSLLVPMWALYNSDKNPLYVNTITGDYLR